MTPTIWELDTQRIGQRVWLFEEVDSTNTLALHYAQDPAHAGLAILARAQTAGRGQRGRSWWCPPGAGVLLSIVLFPPPALRRPVLLTAWAGVSVCELLRELAGVSATLKWPNDVLVQQRKVCGILIEQARGVVVGLGLNLNQSAADFAQAGLPEAGSLALFTGRSFDLATTAQALLRRLDQEYVRLEAGACAALETRWRQYLNLEGRPVALQGSAGPHGGRLRQLTFETLILEQPGGQFCRLLPEQVQQITLLEESDWS
jgi:BirA family biotin operon repressor/biotin-[acetyl-CoA-carboxylase] ligase